MFPEARKDKEREWTCVCIWEKEPKTCTHKFLTWLLCFLSIIYPTVLLPVAVRRQRSALTLIHEHTWIMAPTTEAEHFSLSYHASDLPQPTPPFVPFAFLGPVQSESVHIQSAAAHTRPYSDGLGGWALVSFRLRATARVSSLRAVAEDIISCESLQ